MSVAARLRKLEAQATPGPWQWLRVGSKEGAHICAESGGDAVVEEMESEGPDWEQTDANAAFIVSSRNVLLLLADLAEAAAQLADEIAEDEAMDGECLGRCDSYALPEGELHVDGCPIPALCAVLARVADHLDQGREGR